MMGDISEEKSLIAGETTAFSRASVWQFGTASRLILGGIVMSDTRDEHIYHEMLVQPALLASNSPRKVLIIGGGEGAALREVLKDTRVQNVTMVEIDKGLVHLCKAHLSPMHHGSFDSPKATITFEDGAIFLQRAAPKTFDVVVIDGIDFQEDQSYGNVLFSHPFYQDVFHVLRPGGVLTQYMSHVDRRDEMVAAGFNDTASFTVDVPSFLGAGARFTVAGKGVQERLAARMVRRVQQRASAGALHDWAYLRPKTMVGSLRHRGRRLKGVVSSSDPRYGTGYVGSADFASARAYAAFVVLHTRRRRGTWLDDPADGCTYPPGTPAAGPEALCQSHFSTYYSDEYMLQCRNCDGCSDEVCVTNIVGCENFLSELYTSCKQETQEPEPFGELLFLLSVLIVASCVCCAFWWCLKKVLCGGAPSAAQQQISEARSSMPTCNGAGLSNLELVGSYTEMSQTMNTTYMLTVAPDGEFAGTCSDAEGIQQIHGKIEWYPGQEVGRIAWQETRPNVTTDALGTIRVLASQVAVDAEYLSTYNGETQGAVSLRSTGAAIMVREAAQESPLLLCCGCGPATAGYQGEEMMPLAAPIS